ncbi:MAG: DUF1445 domain-containing protein [Rhizobiaceae bacterium]|nr:DUF1445 domain-containing protein [Rhizobiaceae bacterium]
MEGRVMGPAQWRERFRAGEARQTAALAPGYLQANIAILPAENADDFEAFLRANPAACPMVARGRAGDPSLPALGAAIDIRSDIPKYRIFRDGRPAEFSRDIAGLWRDDLVAFAIGCSLTFEADLVAAGVRLRCHGPGVSCSAFDTAVANVAAGPFGGNLIVTMRAIPRTEVETAIAITATHTDSHGAPVHIGDPAAIGADLGKPIDGLGLTDVREDEVPVFWACGVTMERAIVSAGLPFAITHAPGHMLITDRPAKSGGQT